MSSDFKKFFTITGVFGFFGLFLVFYFFIRPFLPSYHPQDISKCILSFGSLSILAYLFFFTFRYLFALSSTLLSILAGMLWGSLWGTLYGALGSSLNALFLFFLARLSGQKLFQNYLHTQGSQPSLRILTAFIEKKAFLSIFLLRLFPVLLFEGPCVLAGLSKVSPLPYFLGSFLGTLPYSFVFAFSGTHFQDLSKESLTHGAFPVFLIFLFSFVLVLFFRKPILKKMAAWSNSEERAS